MSINDTSCVQKKCVLIYFVCVMVMSLNVGCGAFGGQPPSLLSDEKKALRESYTRVSELFTARAASSYRERWRLFAKVARPFWKLPLSGASLSLFSRSHLRTIEALPVSKFSEASDVLEALTTYYKAFLASNCVRSAFSKDFECGQSMLAPLDVFEKLFDVRDEAGGVYPDNILGQQVQFVIAVRELIASARLVGLFPWLLKRKLQPRIKDAVLKIEVCLPQCLSGDQHVHAMCHRCCAVQVIDMVQEGLCSRGVWHDATEGYGFEKALLWMTGIGALWAWLAGGHRAPAH